jgi:MoaA/NifB/PqqE/SkfB family radical SAM enzyme
MARFVDLARDCGAQSVSFLAADVGNPHAFGRQLTGGVASDIALRPEDLPVLQAMLDWMEIEQAADFRSGFIAERPPKLRRIAAYYAALCGLGEFPPVHCNAPAFSAVIEAGGTIRPCFFIPGPGVQAAADLPRALNDGALRALRTDIATGRRPECARCVCSMWRDPQADFGSAGRIAPEPVAEAR